MVRSINREELKEMMEGGRSFALINALKPEEFENEHICGSVNMPVSTVASEAEKLLSKDNTLIVYCANSACTASSIAADKLHEIGFSDVLRYEGGLEDWKAAGYCVEGMAYKGQAA
jgi:rhodanese-related sulfurtransferase